jgi:hypothetical protein
MTAAAEFADRLTDLLMLSAYWSVMRVFNMGLFPVELGAIEGPGRAAR